MRHGALVRGLDPQRQPALPGERLTDLARVATRLDDQANGVPRRDTDIDLWAAGPVDRRSDPVLAGRDSDRDLTAAADLADWGTIDFDPVSA
jgi:hypothetical protein